MSPRSPDSASPPARPDETRLHLDAPTDKDGLGRADLAAAVGIRLRRLWARANAGRPSKHSLIVHIHGAWGAGKSTFLNILEKRLEERYGRGPERKRFKPFIVVRFNAWEHQHLDPPWWFLLKAIHLEGRRLAGGVFRRAWFDFSEWLWRLACGNGLALLTFFLAAGATVLLIWSLGGLWTGDGGEVADLAALAGSVGAIISFVATLGAGIKFGLTSMVGGSSRAADRMFKHLGNPERRFGSHFRCMIARLGRPVAIFIDDLDRCTPDYTVKLIEGIQTLFTDSRVIYVFAADRRWLECCFQCQYKQFEGHVERPGFSLGHLFVQKLVQLFVALPRPMPAQHQSYWQTLITSGAMEAGRGPATEEQREEAADLDQEADRLLGDRTSETDIMQALQESREQEREGLREAVARKAVVRLAGAEADRGVVHFLAPLAPLLEPNPRSMKRLVNSYTIFRDVALLSDLWIEDGPKDRYDLARWAILAMDAPLLLDYLEEDRGKFDRFTSWKGSPEGIPEYLIPLRDSKRFRRIFEDDGQYPGLSYDALQRFALLRG